MAESWDPKTRQTVQKIPLLTVGRCRRRAAARRALEQQQRLRQLRAGRGARALSPGLPAAAPGERRAQGCSRQVGRAVEAGARAAGGRQLDAAARGTASDGRHPAVRSPAHEQELQALITYIQMNKESDTDWFTIAPEDGGKAWKGKCWCARRSANAAAAAGRLQGVRRRNSRAPTSVQQQEGVHAAHCSDAAALAAHAKPPPPTRLPGDTPPAAPAHAGPGMCTTTSSMSLTFALMCPPPTRRSHPRLSCRSWRARRPRCTAAARSALPSTSSHSGQRTGAAHRRAQRGVGAPAQTRMRAGAAATPTADTLQAAHCDPATPCTAAAAPAASPHFGFAHALCLGLAPWLAAEVPYMVEAGVIQPKV